MDYVVTSEHTKLTTTVVIPKEILESRELTSTAKLIYGRIKSAERLEGAYKHSVYRLAKDLGLAYHTVWNCVKDMKKREIICSTLDGLITCI